MSIIHTGFVTLFFTQDDRLFLVTDNGIILGSDVDNIPNEATVFKNSDIAIEHWKEKYSFIQYKTLFTKAVSRYVVDEPWETLKNTTGQFSDVLSKI